MTKLGLAGRIAYRVEGDNWNAYWALPDTMEGAVFVGSIAMRFVRDPGRKQRFMELVHDGIQAVFEE